MEAPKDENNSGMPDDLKRQTRRGIYWKFLGQFMNYGINFAIGIVMARLLSPDDYGITAMPAILIAVMGIIANGGFGTALIRKEEVSEEDYSTSFMYSMGVGIVCYALLFVGAPYIADFYDVEVLTPVVRVISLGFIYAPIGAIQNVILSRKLDFKTPAKISVVSRIVAGIICITMAYHGYGVWAIVMSTIVSGILSVLITVLAVRWLPKKGWSKDSFRYLWGFGNKIIGACVVGTIYENLSSVIIGKFYSPAQLGIYNRADNYAKLPSQNITTTLQSVTFPVLSKMQGDKERLTMNYRKMLCVTAFVIFPLMLMLAALARPFVITMITEKWESCIVLLQILCLALMWYPIHALNLNLLEVLGRSDLFFRIEVIKKTVGLLIMCATLPMGLECFCWGCVAHSLLELLVNTHYTGQLLGVGLWRQLKDLAHIVLLSAVMYGVVVLVCCQMENMWMQLICGGLAGGIVYVGGALVFRFEEMKSVKYMIGL